MAIRAGGCAVLLVDFARGEGLVYGGLRPAIVIQEEIIPNQNVFNGQAICSILCERCGDAGRGRLQTSVVGKCPFG